MREKRVECPKCKKAMSAGFLLTHARWEKSHLTKWISGAPQASIWSGVSVKGRSVVPVTTYRCESCGFLESYARG